MQRAAELIPVRRKAELNGALLQHLLKRARIELAGALIEQRSHHGGEAGLVGGVGVGAARERVIERHDRYRRFAHQPRLDAAGRGDRLDLARRVGRRHGGEAEDEAERDRDNPAHDFFSTRCEPSLTRYPVTELRLTR